MLSIQPSQGGREKGLLGPGRNLSGARNSGEGIDPAGPWVVIPLFLLTTCQILGRSLKGLSFHILHISYDEIYNF